MNRGVRWERKMREWEEGVGDERYRASENVGASENAKSGREDIRLESGMRRIKAK